jgi:hypothetical protein
VRAIFVTHLHELAENIEALQAGTSGESKIASLVAGIAEDGEVEGEVRTYPAVQEDPAGRKGAGGQDATAGEQSTVKMARRTYQIRPAPPMGMSYAKDIARRHGISFEQLAQELKDRHK